MSNFQNNIPGANGMPFGPGNSVNPFEYPAVKCKHCGCEIFAPGMMFRNVPGALAGEAGKSIHVPLKVFYCVNCHALSPNDQEVLDEELLKAEKNKTIKNNTNSNSIII